MICAIIISCSIIAADPVGLPDHTFPRVLPALETQRGDFQLPQPSRCTNPVPAGNPVDCLLVGTTPAASVVGGFSEVKS